MTVIKDNIFLEKIKKDWFAGNGFEKLAILSLCVLVFVLPFSKSVFEIFFVITFMSCLMMRSSFDGKAVSHAAILKRIFSPINVSIYLFVIANAVSVYYSVSMPLSLRGFFFKLLEGVSLYFITVRVVNDRRKLNLILFSIFLSMALIGIDGVFQRVMGWDILRHYSAFGGLVCASFGNANGFGAWLIIMIPIALSAALTDKERILALFTKNGIYSLAGMLILCLMWTRSAGALIGIAFTMVLFFILRRNNAFLVIAAAILVILFFIAPTFISSRQELFRLVKETTAVNLYKDAAFFGKGFVSTAKKFVMPFMLKRDPVRTNLWREAFFVIKDFPLFGCGLNTYAIVAPKYKILESGGAYPHNSYLQMAAETGISGAGSFVLVVISLFAASIINMKRIKDVFYKNILIGLLAGLFGFLAHSFFDVNLYALQLVNLMWFVMGLIIAIQRIAVTKLSTVSKK